MVTTTNLVSYWKCDEASGNLADSHGSNTLTVTGSPTYSATGIINTGIDFSDAAERFGNTSSTLRPTVISVQAWVKFNVTGEFEWIAGATPSGNWNAGYGLMKDTSDKIRFFINSWNTNFAITTGAMSTGTWYHVVGTYDGTTIKLYVNNTLYSSSYSTAISYASVTEFYAGGHPTGSTAYSMDGILDEVFVQDTAVLSSTDVSDLYNSGSGLAYPFSSDYTYQPSALAMTTTEQAPNISIHLAPSNLNVATSLPTLTLEGATPQGDHIVGPLGGIGTKAIATNWPVEEGLEAGTTTQTGRQMNLIAQTSVITSKERRGL